LENDQDEISDEEEFAQNLEEKKEDQKMEEEAPKEVFKEFRFADLFSKVEDVINTNENVKLKDIFEAVRESCQGTNA
jgi:negative regulator of genetic competence, sporulation and motility